MLSQCPHVGFVKTRFSERTSDTMFVGCLETGAVEYMELSGTSTSATSAAFLKQLRERHTGPLVVIWDNGPAHGGDDVKTYLATPDRALRTVRLPAYSPDFNPDAAIFRSNSHMGSVLTTVMFVMVIS